MTRSGTGPTGTGPTGTELIRTGPIRYATAERFGRPRAVAAGDTRPSSGEICPQPPSRLDAVMGPPRDKRPQGEDCLNLTVTTPARDGGARPVMVWFHGGGFSSGAGLMDWYDGGALAAQGDVVVVGVNYRVGALGYLCLDGVAEGNLGLYDQLEALRWVRAHIAEYGGDPDGVTVFGQSAGGISIRLLMELDEARGLFRRAILQSAPLALTERSRDDAGALGRIFADHLAARGESPGPRGTRRSSTRSARARWLMCSGRAAPWSRRSARSTACSAGTARPSRRTSAALTSCTAGTPTT